MSWEYDGPDPKILVCPICGTRAPCYRTDGHGLVCQGWGTHRLVSMVEPPAAAPAASKMERPDPPPRFADRAVWDWYGYARYLEGLRLEYVAKHGLTTPEVNAIVKSLQFTLARVSLGKREREDAKSALEKLGSP